MNKYLAVSVLSLFSSLAADSSDGNGLIPLNGVKRHGMSVGYEITGGETRTYNTYENLKTEPRNHGMIIGYLYEGAQGACWHVNTKIDGKQKSAHLSTDFRYRMPFNKVILAPIIGLRSDLDVLQKNKDWSAQRTQFSLGAELFVPLFDDVSAAIELKGKRIFAHSLVYSKQSYANAFVQSKYYGLELDIPVRINLTDDLSNQLEIRPYYNYESFSSGKHKAGIQLNFIRWF